MSLSELLAEFTRAPAGASDADIADAERRLGVALPSDYVAFMREADGGEGFVGPEGYVRLWPISELWEANDGYGAKEFYPGHTLIGTNGGGEAIAIRSGPAGHAYVLMPLVGDVDDALAGGETLWDFLQCYGTGRI